MRARRERAIALFLSYAALLFACEHETPKRSCQESIATIGWWASMEATCDPEAQSRIITHPNGHVFFQCICPSKEGAWDPMLRDR